LYVIIIFVYGPEAWLYNKLFEFEFAYMYMFINFNKEWCECICILL